ncbi:MAG: DUF4350 domain-containing protein [Myxococcota bacterium]|jgi:hypothetical protein|nr:DUF4350 domain-containing protein [Myxococcota bacterium]
MRLAGLSESRNRIPSTGIGRGLLAVLMLAFSSLVPASLWALPHDFELESREWNGLSRLQDAALDDGIMLRELDSLDYSALSVERPLLILAPENALQAEDLQQFVIHGGRVLLAVENEAADGLLESLSEPIERIGSPPDDASSRYLNANPKLPIVPSPGRHPLLDGEVQALAANHPQAFVSALPPVIAFERWELGLVYDLSLGDGKLLLLGDASVFINLMQPFANNARFSLNALRYLCEGRSICHVDVYAGRFAQDHSFSAGPPPPTAADRLERALAQLNRLAESWSAWKPDERLLRIMTFMLCIGLILLGLTIFPMQSPAFLSYRLRPPAERQPQSDFARNVLELSRRRQASYNLPLALLRDDFERKLMFALYGEQRPGSEHRYSASGIAELAHRFGQRILGDEAELRHQRARLTALLRELADIPSQSHLLILHAKQWNRADLLRLHAEAQACLGALEQGERPSSAASVPKEPRS